MIRNLARLFLALTVATALIPGVSLATTGTAVKSTYDNALFKEIKITCNGGDTLTAAGIDTASSAVYTRLQDAGWQPDSDSGNLVLPFTLSWNSPSGGDSADVFIDGSFDGGSTWQTLIAGETLDLTNTAVSATGATITSSLTKYCTDLRFRTTNKDGATAVAIVLRFIYPAR